MEECGYQLDLNYLIFERTVCAVLILVGVCYSLFLQKNAKVVSIDGYEDVPENDENALKKAVANQPVSVAIEAGGREFQLYQSVRSLSNMVY